MLTPADLLDLAHRKNAAHKELLRMRGIVRHPAGSSKMTEKDRDIDMDFRTLDEREVYENLCDEYAIRMATCLPAEHMPERTEKDLSGKTIYFNRYK